MFKVILLLKKRPELTREQFMDYYDNEHVPSMHAILSTGACIHRRNFVISDDPNVNVDCDVITELFYENREHADAAMKSISNPETRKIIEADEDKFILRGSLRKYVVEVHETVFERIPEQATRP